MPLDNKMILWYSTYEEVIIKQSHHFYLSMMNREEKVFEQPLFILFPLDSVKNMFCKRNFIRKFTDSK